MRPLRRRYAHGGRTYDVDAAPHEGRLRAHVDGRETACEARLVREFAGGAEIVLVHDGGRARAFVVRDGDVVHVAVGGRVHRLGVVAARAEESASAGAGALDPLVASPMTGVIRHVAAEPGRSFAAGATLVIVEAMKMEFAVVAPRDVVVADVRAKAGDRVDIGEVLVTFARADA